MKEASRKEQRAWSSTVTSSVVQELVQLFLFRRQDGDRRSVMYCVLFSTSLMHLTCPCPLQEAMEVVVTEEKKKIFRARKTMKMSDRLQLESLHSTLLTNPSPPPLVNGTHKEDAQKEADKEQNNVCDQNSPHTVSPSTPTPTNSPAPFLSLNLSPSTASSQSPNHQEEASSPTSPFHSDFPEVKKPQEVEKKSSSPPPSDETLTPVSSESDVTLVGGTEVKG